jgi:hypothetical protein
MSVGSGWMTVGGARTPAAGRSGGCRRLPCAAHRVDSRELVIAGRDQAARAALEEELFGKHVLITDHDD